MWRCSLDPKHARWARVSLLFQLFVQSFSTPFGSFLSFLVSEFVMLCQNDVAMLSKGGMRGSEYIGRFFGTFYCFRASCRVLLIFFSFFIRFAPSGREREGCRAFERWYCLFAVTHLVSQPSIFGSRNCKFVVETLLQRVGGELDMQSAVYKMKFKCHLKRKSDIFSPLHYFFFVVYISI